MIVTMPNGRRISCPTVMTIREAFAYARNADYAIGEMETAGGTIHSRLCGAEYQRCTRPEFARNSIPTRQRIYETSSLHATIAQRDAVIAAGTVEPFVTMNGVVVAIAQPTCVALAQMLGA